MARDILSEFGRDSHQPQANPLQSGGDMPCRDVMGYEPPAGPKHITETGTGLRGGKNFGNAGSQGKYSLDADATGSPGDLTTRTFLGGSQRG